MYFFLFLIVIVVVAIMFIIGKIGEAKTNSLRRKVEDIKKQYPLAYEDYLNKNKLSIHSASNSALERLISASYGFYSKEGELLRQKREREINEREYKSIESNFPHGLKKWKEKNGTASIERIVSRRGIIQSLEENYQTAQSFNQWEKEQSDFKSKCYAISKETLTTFGRYHYDIPFTKIDEDGNHVAGNYEVWQFFAESYCLERDLDYTDYAYIKKNFENLPQFKGSTRYFLEPVYDKLNAFILKLSEEYEVSVYLCSNNPDWNRDSLFYHYSNKAKWEELPDTIDIEVPVSDAVLFGEDVDHGKYPKLKNRHIVIVEMQTDNSHLKEVCSKIIEANKEKKPLMTYISLLKGYDRDEMQELIDEEKKNKREEAEKKRKEIEAEKRRIQKEKEDIVIKICNRYGITGLFHMTHISNLESILNHGLLSHTKAREDGFMKVDIANNDVNYRRAHPEPIHNRPIHDYAPLYFNPHNPMLYVRKNMQSDIVLVEFSPTVFLKDNVIFSDGNAAVHTTATYNNRTEFYSDLNDLSKLDWECINADYWNDYPDGKRIKCAEVLVPDIIEASYITRIHYSPSLMNTKPLERIAKQHNIDIVCSPELYF